MEALKFLKEYERMCNECKTCYGCPLDGTACSIVSRLSEKEMINIIEKTEQWSKDHPIKTNAQMFKEVFGFVPAGYQTTFYSVEPNNSYSKTIIWQAPYKEPEHEAM